tara:strand:+ start:16973 stop:18751 length:1779 start_codon:yes stop_codon:yes gene_type:complete
MPRNRIIHNVQEIFAGSAENEVDDIVTGIAGYQILKRVNHVQSFNYKMELKHEKASVLGKSAPIADDISNPPSISLDFSYYLNGVNNEKRLGLTSANSSANTDLWSKSMAYEMVDSLRDKDKRNIYLVINNNNQDLREPAESYYPRVDMMGDEWQYTSAKDFIDPNSTGYGVVVFQNCYLDSYRFVLEQGSMPLVNVSYAADNVIAYASGSGINIPYLDSKKGEVTDTVATVYTSDFNAGLDGWTAASTSHFEYHEGGGPGSPAGSGSIHFRADTGTSSHYMQRNIFTVGKKYRVTGDIYINSTNPILKSVRIHDGYGVTLDNITDHDEWVPFEVEFTAVSELLVFYGMNSTSDYNWASAGTSPYDDFYIADIVVTEIKEFIIPKQFKEAGGYGYPDVGEGCGLELLSSKNVEFTLSPHNEEGMSFHKDLVQSCEISFQIDRKDVSTFGNKLYSDRVPNTPIEVAMSVDLIVKENVTGSFLSNRDKDALYDATLDIKNLSGVIGARYKITNAKLDAVSNESSVNSNKVSSLNFHTYMNLDDDNSSGLFLSGKVVDLVVDVLHHHQDDPPAGPEYILNDDHQILRATIGHPQF